MGLEDWNVQLYAVAPRGEHVQALLPSRLPLRGKRKLQWTGFTDCSNLGFSDDAGNVFLRRKDGCWIKVLSGCRRPIVEIKESRRTILAAKTEDRLEDWPPGVVNLRFHLPFLPVDGSHSNHQGSTGKTKEVCLSLCAALRLELIENLSMCSFVNHCIKDTVCAKSKGG
ncbi:uncharacterized protein LOC142767920 [Rhipicephalus microplus]|uniref:uncharacterized protein LOC142767920 n=1 Tax=Rhipicephalus microplus TaxID=6941 RepID=UPI003F6BB1C4